MIAAVFDLTTNCAYSFLLAYVAYKMKTVDEQIKATYAKKIGGLGDYKRDLKREAEVMWNRSK